MRHTRSRRLPLTLTVFVISAAIGIAVGVDQLHTARPVIEEIEPVSPSPAASTINVQPTATPQPLRYSLFVPALGVTARLIHLSLSDGRWNVDGLGDNVGHLLGTSWFEDAAPGNVVLAGHVELRDGRPGIFARLHELPIGETIVIRTDQELRRYRITASYETTPSDLSPLYPARKEILTLITCSDYDFLANAYHTRRIVVAERI